MVNDLEAMQAIVGGYIELMFLPKGYMAVVNEEGRLRGLAPSARINGQVIVGTFFVTKVDPEDSENFAGLTHSDVAVVHQWVHPIAEARWRT